MSVLRKRIAATLSAAVMPLYEDAVMLTKGMAVPDGRLGFTHQMDWSGCKARIEDYSDHARAAAGIPAKHRRIRVLASSIFSGIDPEAASTVYFEADAEEWDVIKVDRSPCRTYFDLQAHR